MSIGPTPHLPNLATAPGDYTAAATHGAGYETIATYDEYTSAQRAVFAASGGSITRLRPVPDRSAVDAPCPTDRAGRAAVGGTGTAPAFTVIRSTKEEADSVPAQRAS
jgi:hypothetical protein